MGERKRGLFLPGIGSLSINTQESQAKGLLKWQWLPVSGHCPEELGTKQNALVYVSDRKVAYDRPPQTGWPVAPKGSVAPWAESAFCWPKPRSPGASA